MTKSTEKHSVDQNKPDIRARVSDSDRGKLPVTHIKDGTKKAEEVSHSKVIDQRVTGERLFQAAKSNDIEQINITLNDVDNREPKSLPHVLMYGYNHREHIKKSFLYKAIIDNNLLMPLLNIINNLKNANIDNVRKALVLSCDPESVKYNCNTPGGSIIHIALKQKKYEVVEQLLDIAKAIKDNNKTLKKVLLLKSEYGNNVLYVAVKHGNLQIVQILLKNIQDIKDDGATLKQMFESQNSVGVAINKRFFDKVVSLVNNVNKYIKDNAARDKILLPFNKSIEAKIYVALYNGEYEKLKELSRINHIKFFEAVQQGVTPLYNATMKQDFNKVKDLLDSNKKISKTALKDLLLSHSKLMGTALHAVALNQNVYIYELLLQAAAEVDDNNDTVKNLLLSRNMFNETALHISAKHGHDNIVKELLQTAENVRDDNITYNTLLFYCSHPQYIEELLNPNKDGSYNIDRYKDYTAGTFITICGDHGRTALFEAVQWGKYDIIRILLEAADKSRSLNHLIDITKKNKNLDSMALNRIDYELKKMHPGVNHNMGKREANNELESADSKDNHNNQEDEKQKTTDDKSSGLLSWIPNIFPQAEASTIGNNNKVAYQSEHEALKHMDYSSMVDSTTVANLDVYNLDGKSPYSNTSMKQIENLSVPLCPPSVLAQVVNDNMIVLLHVVPYLVSKIFGTSKPSNSNYITPSQEFETQLDEITSKVLRVIPLKESDPECTEDVLIDMLHLGDCNG